MALLPEMRSYKERVKLCFAFFASNVFFHQELTVLCPEAFYIYVRDYDAHSLSLQELQSLTKQGVSPVVCYGSHRPEEPRTIQVTALADLHDPKVDLLPNQLLMIRFLTEISEEEKNKIKTRLIEAFTAL